MIDNKSPGVDRIAPEIVKETAGKLSMPLAHVCSMSMQKGIVPLEWKETKVIPLFKQRFKKQVHNYRPLSLTSLICKLL